MKNITWSDSDHPRPDEVKTDQKRYLYFDIIGAGKLEISKSNEVQCGGKTGFSFGVEWGMHGYTGGLISREEAIRLAEYILEKCEPKSKSLRRIKLNKINSIL